MFTGSIVAVVTPMHPDGSIDETAFASLIEWHIASGTKGIVIAGTTGESPTLSHEEKIHLFKLAVKQVKKRIPVIAGTGSNNTKETALFSKAVCELGVDGLLIVTPYYNKPTQEGLYQHFKHIAEHVTLPMILYNVPGRTVCDLLPETVKRLSECKHIVSVKEATGKVERVKEILNLCGSKISVLSGDDPTGLDAMLQGAQGVISVTANVAPEKMAKMCEAALKGDLTKASQLNNELALLHTRLFLDPNPTPAKWVLHKIGKIDEGIRLPLVTLDKRHHQAVMEAMQQAGVKLCVTSEE